MGMKDDLGSRIKENYEQISQTKLLRRTPVAIRIDGKAFHAFTRGLDKPFDEILTSTMQETMQKLCENIQGCVFGYTQSDEITLILQDYKKLETAAWFDYKVQKVCSIAASMATLYFNKIFSQKVEDYLDAIFVCQDHGCMKEEKEYVLRLSEKVEKGAMFDARCFNIPKEEVTNLLYWRQLDAVRNSTQMIGQYYFSQKELQDKSCKQIVEMLRESKSVELSDYPIRNLMGVCCFKELDTWFLDYEIPRFNEDRNYIEKHINCEEE